jgi:IclR family transcriptional regulator, acetate operon repressor
VEKALDILECLARSEYDLSLSELGRSLGLGKSTVHRLLLTLERRNMIARDGNTRRYSLGFGLLHLSSRLLARLDLRIEALPHLRYLRDVTGETASVVVRIATGRVHLEEVPGVHDLRYTLDVGTELPLLIGASGLALMAWSEEAEVDRFIASEGLPACSPSAVTDPVIYKKELTRTRDRGYAVSVGWRSPDVVSVAAPIRSLNGNVIGALNVSGPVSRFTEIHATEVGPVVAGRASAVSEALGLVSTTHRVTDDKRRSHGAKP